VPSLAWSEQPRDLVLGGAATYRLARLVTEDEITRPLREKILERSNGGRLAYFITCPWCVSFWAGGLLAAGLTTVPRVTRAAAAALAWSAAAGFLSSKE
jgi:hypothetical protein